MGPTITDSSDVVGVQRLGACYGRNNNYRMSPLQYATCETNSISTCPLAANSVLPNYTTRAWVLNRSGTTSYYSGGCSTCPTS